MIISRIKGGIGNQLFQYAMGRRLAHKLNTEFKLDISFFNTDNFRPYSLNRFNITATLATAEEISSIKTSGEGIKNEVTGHQFDPQVLDYPDNIYLNGY